MLPYPYLHRLPENEGKERVFKLSKLYLQEMNVEVKTVKEWLIEIGKPISKVDNHMDDEYLNALKNIQETHGLGDDGIFGYRTLNLLNQLRKEQSEASESVK